MESGHAALKRWLGVRQPFRTRASAKATPKGIETIRTIKKGHIENKAPGVRGEIAFVHRLFDIAA